MALTEAQESVLINCALYSRLAGDYFYEPGDGVQQRTLDSLVKKGILSGKGSSPYRYWLTDAGSILRDKLIRQE